MDLKQKAITSLLEKYSGKKVVLKEANFSKTESDMIYQELYPFTCADFMQYAFKWKVGDVQSERIYKKFKDEISKASEQVPYTEVKDLFNKAINTIQIGNRETIINACNTLNDGLSAMRSQTGTNKVIARVRETPGTMMNEAVNDGWKPSKNPKAEGYKEFSVPHSKEGDFVVSEEKYLSRWKTRLQKIFGGEAILPKSRDKMIKDYNQDFICQFNGKKYRVYASGENSKSKQYIIQKLK